MYHQSAKQIPCCGLQFLDKWSSGNFRALPFLPLLVCNVDFCTSYGSKRYIRELLWIILISLTHMFGWRECLVLCGHLWFQHSLASRWNTFTSPFLCAVISSASHSSVGCSWLKVWLFNFRDLGRKITANREKDFDVLVTGGRNNWIRLGKKILFKTHETLERVEAA